MLGMAEQSWRYIRQWRYIVNAFSYTMLLVELFRECELCFFLWFVCFSLPPLSLSFSVSFSGFQTTLFCAFTFWTLTTINIYEYIQSKNIRIFFVIFAHFIVLFVAFIIFHSFGQTVFFLVPFIPYFHEDFPFLFFIFSSVFNVFCRDVMKFARVNKNLIHAKVVWLDYCLLDFVQA